MRPEAPFYVGTTRPSSVGWTRIALTLVAGVVAVVLVAGQLPMPVAVAAGAVFALLALWTWMGQWTRFIVDGHGVTVSLGGFLPRAPWPLADFRTVQLREVPSSSVGVTVGGFGWRRGRAMAATPEQVRPVGKLKVYTLGEVQARYRLLVTRSGTQVEIISREGDHYLLSPVDVEATAAAIEQAIRARR
ncbi:hypothetical protein [Brachybacterium sp. J153]|uniref:hypothetical protein n=1 Tax=Brachybacterium sp. J153 TaxID=3116488 RepID=UPI002E789ABF|nr:hypothetical protein [Brachybacterium sp. J153]MEE1619225.1 hypothetical protein [Brachybacterium sp. J153]